ncbi:hypothetical protein [Motilimonas eburnea]|uniref:hypothetical protein n=1 Tax=Motilimonas eburnea TaxID=1737488 RepID=UPI001E4EE556|nr:hypothetical protein [Motilimonas eburnea]MCE2572222.1 hypothetical protein [Motilimonas eburnea]
MNDLHDIFTQAYWWLSLLGGLHCFAFALYLNLSQEKSKANRLLVTLFVLIGWYFFTGLISKGLTPLPMHVILPLLYPSYFLLMPILYGYCKASLQPEAKLNIVKHSLTAIAVGLIVLTIMLYHWLKASDVQASIPILSQAQQIDVYALLLPSLTLVQAACYFGLIWRFIKRNNPIHKHQREELSQIRFRWMSLLVIGTLVNWLMRIALIYLPFYAGELPSMQVQAITRFSLLITVYIFAFYGFHQISRAAYLRGLAQANRNALTSSQKVLDADEMAFLQDVLAESTNQTNTTKR